jgi:hypothetical protein
MSYTFPEGHAVCTSGHCGTCSECKPKQLIPTSWERGVGCSFPGCEDKEVPHVHRGKYPEIVKPLEYHASDLLPDAAKFRGLAK